MPKRLRPALKKFAAAKQQRLDALLDKNAEGKITASEKTRLEALVAEAERLMADNAKLLIEWANAQVTDEELHRRLAKPGGRSSAEIWRRLGPAS